MKINTMIHASLSRFKKTTYIPSVYVQGRLFRQIVVDCVLITHKYIYVINNIRYKRFLFISLSGVQVSRRG